MFIYPHYFFTNFYLLSYIDRLSKLIGSFDNTIDKRMSIKERIWHIDKLRMRAIFITQLKDQFYIFMWEDTYKIFENILEHVWKTGEEHYEKITAQTELLNSTYQALHDREQHKLDTKVNNGLSLLQVLAIPLTIFLLF